MKPTDLALACLSGAGVYTAIALAIFHHPRLALLSLAVSIAAAVFLALEPRR